MPAGKYRKFRALPGRDRRIYLAASAALPLVALALKMTSLGRVQTVLMRSKPRPSNAADNKVDVVRMVELAAHRGVWRANCLQRSVVLWWFLRRKGIETEIRIGVRRADGGGGLAFHAWVERDGQVLNDRPDVATEYASFDRAIVPAGARLE